jgi:hypothetical protein
LPKINKKEEKSPYGSCPWYTIPLLPKINTKEEKSVWFLSLVYNSRVAQNKRKIEYDMITIIH